MAEILCLNAGSSSLKFALYATPDTGEPTLLANGKIENIGLEPHLIARDAKGEVLAERRWTKDGTVTHETLLEDLLREIETSVGDDLIGVGHRIVHGGADHSAPARVDEALLAALEALCPLAPLHQPHNLAAIRAVSRLRPALPQVACFDTGFHHGQLSVATRLALPRALSEEGMRRYGFHGVSYEYIARQLRSIDPGAGGGRTIAAHLGNGASLCAMDRGRSIDTTMGFTALDGLVMGTRSGALDPGAVLYLFQQKGMTAREVEHLLYSESGLLGVSGISSDMRALLGSETAAAQEAIDLFVWQIARQAGALASSLGGLDSFVFTAGIGENAPEVRARVAERLGWLGVELDVDANLGGAAVISAPSSRVEVRVIPTDEERMIAIHTADLLREEPKS
ncbi:acetate/propionate family kinase [Sphingomonas sp. AP4-R1]|uniref:acetate/propionate family kinase n=1 Tax=Sphingomonas sp. AP4-R1 TaxID=2735134 RepID=UPI0014932B7E|nr:acetate/propionate family kinase [Sphingomonas sp. AP4-R1]QJU58275.1 acetate/propionate family kinase [Sphingomonas sp. AP4-R1]